jgi:hypothetical protein
MKKPKKQWPPVPGIQKISKGKGDPLRIRTDQAIDVGRKIAEAIRKGMKKYLEEKDVDRVRDPLSIGRPLKSFRGWRTKDEFDRVQAAIAGV